MSLQRAENASLKKLFSIRLNGTGAVLMFQGPLPDFYLLGERASAWDSC